MATYGDLKTRIAREMHRTDLTADIAAHVLSAVAFYANSRFDGNEKQWTLTTIAGTKNYGTDTAAPGTLPPDLVEIDSITASVGNRLYRLDKQSFAHLEDIDVGNTTLSGYPREWAWFQQKLRVYPTPNGAYTLTISGQCALTALSADADSNFWTNQGEPLIRARAKKTLAMDVMNNPATASLMSGLEAEYLRDLKAGANKLIASGRLAPTRF